MSRFYFVGVVMMIHCNANLFAYDSEIKIDPLKLAQSHPIVRDIPGPDFFEGALLGNGGLGAVVTTRPDAVVVHFGHNNVWDIRIAENHKDKIGTFQEIFERVKAIPAEYEKLEEDPWYAEYMKLTRDNYDKPYPRPFPCGSLVLGFDRRKVELLGYHLDISNGMCVVKLLVEGQMLKTQLFVDMASDQLWIRVVDANDQPIPNPFTRVRLMPDPDTPQDIPPYQVLDQQDDHSVSFMQILPFNEPINGTPGETHSKDRYFRICFHSNSKVKTGTRVDWEGQQVSMGPLEKEFSSSDSLVGVVTLHEGLAKDLNDPIDHVSQASQEGFISAFHMTQQVWMKYWNQSAVQLEDDVLERTWYWNHYFFNCATKPGVNCPGLFANWSYRKIGTAWHGDYHMNYNTQQPFWLPFSSNRIEKNLAYVELVERLLPLSQKWAREYYGLRGAYFPHSAYPVEMTISPYPVPTWGWEICETPWTVQGLWWHYLYTMDKHFLQERAFGPIREAVRFLVDYMKRPEARGPQWGDDLYHIFPTVPPELYGLRPGFKFNSDCLVDLTLVRFIFNAFQQALQVLQIEEKENDLLSDVRNILSHFPEYPTADSHYGRVFVSVTDENSETVYNTPNSLMTLFPGEDHGLHSDSSIKEILLNTLRNNQNEGGNDLVFLNLQAARIGALDLERFKRQINYCLLPNGTCTDMVLQVGGRYNDTTPFDFMRPMGIWFENFSLPVVINECLLQSYNGVIRLFPNWPGNIKASFVNLRAVGAFLVSAIISENHVKKVVVFSEAGSPLRLINPWQSGARIIHSEGEITTTESLLVLPTKAGETIHFYDISIMNQKN